MRIAVDARQIFRPERRGIGNTLVPVYAELAARRPTWRFFLLHQLRADVPELARANVRAVRLDTPGAHRGDSWERAVLPAAAWCLRADVLHAPTNTGPTRSPVPVALTVHDLIPAESADRDPAARAWLERIRASARAARVVTTPSDYTRGVLASTLGLDPAAVVVTPWAPAARMRPIADRSELDRVRIAYGIDPGAGYVFGFGAADPRKNTARLIRAYAALPPELRAAARLLLVGIQDAALPDYRKLIASLDVGQWVTLKGFADAADLPALLSAATVVAFPSLSEGFGLPLLDAFACGAAVLTGDRTSLPEVAGGAALLVDPGSDEAVRAGLERLLREPKLRIDLAARGLARAAEFDWGRTADALADALERSAAPCRRPNN